MTGQARGQGQPQGSSSPAGNSFHPRNRFTLEIIAPLNFSSLNVGFFHGMTYWNLGTDLQLLDDGLKTHFGIMTAVASSELTEVHILSGKHSSLTKLAGTGVKNTL